ncbi:MULTISPECIES: ribonucleoside-diphosphate reductase subunit alpha [Zunongwangia]|jgi:ribonucleoside-diphosphate reductase alpha chain|uniref:Ribonucleoside-diphosphate reductase n=2 Tax=Zunongwangia profunda TaxID=398743 RepID=D5BGT2_ZUNPS|nr:ribonucleoside-diphosphate reductase subunit alpha [Zunongwangia profunda]MAC63211.1 ribonucleoside-diphosphate reductase, alpha chain [Flavobacteriaceae bacterium]MAS69538.1 ribonucleoside-diphosphate reductase, alpha chain [Zunongwangia sp.]ADF53263.1 ribonucleotide-diphosphate reductase subunit alpha [Zunongwangia profunda SM-A87]MCC4229435.1 ribonucleoside-diphosphate reductase subunit alpha [Zunongwangia profunda]HAJ80976.1 ribonucleoside-diphosphate reductase subunit alpha [Zunongwang|tara:strand:+ start:1873 stop:3567 length:1695 start_codon:yes stop_codon:yes gene_type:complete
MTTNVETQPLIADEPKNKRLWWLNDESQQILNRGYLLKGETVKSAIERIANASAKRLYKPELAEAFIEMIERGWMSLSSPIWANMGTERGLPISCFNVYVPDNIEGITHKLGEVIMQTKIGGGTSGYFGELRGRGSAVTDNGKSSGATSFMKLFDTAMDTISQGGVRRGAFAAYLDIDHPDIKEFLEIKNIGNPIQNLFYGVCVPDYWMQEMIEGDMEKREIWAKVLESRQQKGLPYILFKDNINRFKPQVYKDKNRTIHSSNLCSEIALPSTEDESFICCLSSMNLELYDEWKDTEAVKLAIYFLDGVLQEFIAKTEGNHYLASANRFAKNHRALGLGAMGWHSYLQKNRIPFEGMRAKGLTHQIFEDISAKATKASKELATIYGEPEMLKGYGLRNTTLMAIAPTTSSSAILGQTSPGIEPFSSNYYKAGLAKGNFMRKNKYLKQLLEEKGLDNEDTWRSIMLHHGSVQHLETLTQEEKDIFKTFKEISQLEIIQQASVRQKFIDQAQSLNLNIPAGVPVRDVNQLMIEAWKLGVKTLYYQRSQSVSKEFVSNIVNCSSCEA